MSEKKSQFIEIESLTDSQYVNVFGSSVDRKISKPNLFKQIKDESFSPFIYPTIELLQAANLEVDVDNPTYCRCEETEYRLYKITNAAAGVDDIALTNGNTATYQIEYRDTGFVTSVATAATGALAVFTDSTGQELDKSVVPTNTGKALIQAADGATVAFPRKNADNTVTMRSASQYFDDIKQNATHGAAGVIKTADGTSTLAQTATDEAITPANLADLKASSAEVLTGTNTVKYVTPETLQDKFESDGILTIATVADISTTPMQAGQVFELVEYAASTEIGGDSFKAFAGSITTDNGVTFNGPSGFYLKRLNVYKYVTPEMFGAAGDGSINDTVAVLAANLYSQTSGLPLFLPQKYLINSRLEIKHGQKIFGCGYNASELIASSTFSDSELIYANGTIGGFWLGYFSLSDIKLSNPNGKTIRGARLIGAVWEWNFTNVVITDMYLSGLYLDRCYRGQLINCGWYDCGQTGSEQTILLTSTLIGDRCSNIKFIGGNIQDAPAGTFAVKFDGAVGCNFDTTVFQSNGRGAWFVGTSSCGFYNCYMEDLDRELYLTASAGQNCKDTFVRDTSLARNTYTNPVLLEGDEDTVFDKVRCDSNVITITKNANSKRARIYNSPRFFFNTGSKGWIGLVDDSFYGASLDTQKYTLSVTGSGSGALQNAASGVYRVSTGTTGSSTSQLVYGNNYLHLMSENPVIEVRAKLIALTNVLFRPIRFEGSSAGHVMVQASNSGSATNVQLITNDGTTTNTQSAALVIDTNYHIYKLICTSSRVELYIDGVLQATSTANIPAQSMRLVHYIGNSAAEAKDMDIDYVTFEKDV